ncbi:uncharacterized protein [Littorina saxatilis]|uniref:Uncharacterized protein n=1 Tax=Littorina saxatilis TaxID=31220 RepID=A0AAN9G172_9CAEN
MSSPRYGARGGVESTTSYDSHSEEDLTRDRTYSATRGPLDTSRDATRDTSYSQRDVTFHSHKDATFQSKGSETSTNTERQGSYDVYYPPYEKTECSCDEAGGWQKCSFLLLIITFMGHAIAVTTPYWVVAYEGDQMTVYEGVWLSCYRDRSSGSWTCSTYDTIRNLFEQPAWYEAAQVCAVLSLILLFPALIVGPLYSYVVSLRGRSRASGVLVAFLASSAFCSFVSFVTFAGGYPTNQKFPPGYVRFHVSFALQIISFLFCLLTLATHIRDSYPGVSLWDNKMCASGINMPKIPASKAPRTPPGESHIPRLPPTGGSSVASAPPAPKVSVTKSSGPKLSFSFPKFPSALSRFRSKGENPSAPPVTQDTPDRLDVREASDDKLDTLQAPPSAPPSQRAGANSTSYKSYAPSSDSMSGYDSQV